MSIRDIKKKYKILFITAVAFVGLLTLSKSILKVSLLRAVGLKGIDTAIIKLTCLGKNKQYTTWGLAGNPICVTVYPDKGKSCKSSSECLSGLCVRTRNIEEPYCRGFSGNSPLCNDGEATVEYIEEVRIKERGERLKFGPFLWCD